RWRKSSQVYRLGIGVTLSDPGSELRRGIWPQQPQLAVLLGGGEDEHLRAHTRNTAGWQVEDAYDLAVEQLIARVLGLQRGDRMARPQRSKVDPQPVGRLARLRKIGNVDDHADPHVKALEVVDRDRHLTSETTSRASPTW